MNRARRTFDWALRTIEVNNAQFYGVCLGIGLLLAAMAWVLLDAADREKAAREREHAAEVRSTAALHRRDVELAAAIRRITRLEKPTRAELRRILSSLLRSAGPMQLQLLQSVTQGGSAGTAQGGTSSGGGSGSAGGGGQTQPPSGTPVPPPPDHPSPIPQPAPRPPRGITTPPVGPIPPIHICLPIICRVGIGLVPADRLLVTGVLEKLVHVDPPR